MIRIAAEQIGNTAEFLVCHDLSSRGFRTCLSPFAKSPYDVLCEYRNKFLRVQVKGTGAPVSRRSTKNKYYLFNLKYADPSNYDLLALVATDLKTIHYVVPHVKDFTLPSPKSYSIGELKMATSNDTALVETMKSFGEVSVGLKSTIVL